MKNKVDSMSKIGGYASYDVGFQNSAAQKTASKQPELS